MKAWLIQIDAYDGATATTLRMASHDDDRLCHLDGQTWWPVIAKLPTLRYDFFDGSFDGGSITSPSGTLEANIEAIPSLPRLAIHDARIRIWGGELGDAFSSFVLTFDGRVKEQPSVDGGAMSISFGADDSWLDQPMLATYAGTGGAEGGTDLEGQVKTLALGTPPDDFRPPLRHHGTHAAHQDAEAAEIGEAAHGVIPTRSKTDTCPLPCCDGTDAAWIGDEEAPCGGAGLDDVFVGWPDVVAELVASQIVPDILHRVQLRRVWRYVQQADVAGHRQFASGLVPSRAVADHHGMRARGDLGADLCQVDAHRLAVGRRQDDGSTRRPGRAQRAEQVNGVPPVVPHRARPRAGGRPDVFKAALLAHAGFVLEPDLDGLAGSVRGQDVFQQSGEVFLKASSASGSFCGW